MPEQVRQKKEPLFRRLVIVNMNLQAVQIALQLVRDRSGYDENSVDIPQPGFHTRAVAGK
jgi:hypothetical protein